MKKVFFLAPLFFFLFGFTASHAVDEKTNRLLQLLNLTEETAKADIFHAVTGPSFFIPNVKAFKTISPEERVSTIKLIGKSIKEYVASKEFIEKYNQYREEKKPRPPQEPKHTEELKNEQRENLKKSIAELEKNKANVAKNQQAIFDELIKGLNQQVQAIDDPKNQMFTPEMNTSMQQAHALRMNEYAKNVAAWELAYPKNNPNPMIKRWMTTFLDSSSGIDFDAKTEAIGGKIKFTQPEYEQKDRQWKFYFRAGKEAVTAARTFAQDWLEELR